MLEILRKIDTSPYLWCSDAALVRLSGGKNVLKKTYSDHDEDYSRKSLLTLNGKSIIQGEYPDCPTCSALLARGYGIENTDCAELRAVRDKINSGYTDIETGIHNIEPIMGLLSDGYYVIADCELYPTCGERHFFGNVPDKLTLTDAACGCWYNSDFMDCVDCFPAYIYPTQSNSALDTERAEHYYPVIDKPDAPRAIALYDFGFVCALLDGHHKAYAAAKKGVPLKTLVMIRVTGYSNYNQKENRWECISFTDIKLPLSDIDISDIEKQEKYSIVSENIDFTEYHNEPMPENELKLSAYPTIRELTGIYAAGMENEELTEELIGKLMKSKGTDDLKRLWYMLQYKAIVSPPSAYEAAKTVIALSPEYPDYNEIISAAYRIVMNKRCDKSEQMAIDYLIGHDKTAPAYDICNSYWD